MNSYGLFKYIKKLKTGRLKIKFILFPEKKVNFNCLFLRNKIVCFSVTFDAQFLKYFEGYPKPSQVSSRKKLYASCFQGNPTYTYTNSHLKMRDSLKKRVQVFAFYRFVNISCLLRGIFQLKKLPAAKLNFAVKR